MVEMRGALYMPVFADHLCTYTTTWQESTSWWQLAVLSSPQDFPVMGYGAISYVPAYIHFNIYCSSYTTIIQWQPTLQPYVF